MVTKIARPANISSTRTSNRIGQLASTTGLGTLASLALCLVAQPALAGCIDDGAGHVDCTGTFAGFRGVLSVPTFVTIEPTAASTGTITLSGNAAASVANNGTIATTAGRGVSVTSNDAVTVTSTGPVTTSGPNSTGIRAYSGVTGGGGNVAVTATSVIVSGPGSTGINAQTYGAGSSSTVNAGTVASTNGSVTGGGAPGSGSYSVIAYSQSGAVSVTTGTVTSRNSAGIFALGGGSSVSVQSGDVTVTGNGFGISDIAFDGAAKVSSTGTVSVQGDGFFGIYAMGQRGVSVNGGGNVSTSGANSVGVFAYSPGGDVSVATGRVTTAGNASTGVSASAPNGAITITTGPVATTGDSANAISATSNGAIAITATGPVTTSGANATGVFAYSGAYAPAGSGTFTGGSIAISTGDVVVSGSGGTGINAQTYGAGSSATVVARSVTVSNGTTVSGGSGGFHGTYGVLAYSQSGAVSVTTGTVTTHNAGGIAAVGGGPTVTVNSGNVTVTGGGFGISAFAFQGAASIASTGTVSVQNDGFFGIYAMGQTGVTVSGSGNVSTIGAGSTGIFATSAAGNVSVAAGAIGTGGASSNGVTATSNTGTVAVTLGSVAVKGAGAVGISATGAGATSVTVGAASAIDSPAVVATSTGGAARITLNGATTTGSGFAATASGATTAALTVGAGGTLSGSGALLTSAAGSTVTNNGTITGGAVTPVLSAVGGPLAFTNNGSFTGLIAFTSGNDVVTNAGTYRLSVGQDFGAGNDIFSNSGSLLVAPAATGATTIVLSRLEAFTNSGLVDLRNGHAGDVLTTSSGFTGSGSSTLALDIAFGTIGSASVADRLNAAGVIGGSTTVILQRIGTNPVVLDPGTVIATGAAGSSANAFQIAGDAINQGLVRMGIAYNAASGTYSLVVTPSNALYHTLKINEGAQQLWQSSADSWSAHMGDLNEAHFVGTSAANRLWGQFYGAAATRKNGATFSAFGLSQAVDLSYRQDVFGGQLGFDLDRSGALTFGVTGGYLDSHLNYRNSADHVTYQAANIGAYASISSGSIFANLLGKYDRVWARAQSRAGGYDAKLHGSSYGVSAEAGVRLGGKSAYAEPLVSLSYVRTDFGSIASLGQTIDLDALNGLRGKAGLRLGTQLNPVTTLYGQAAYVHEFDGKNGITFTSGGQSLAYRNDPIGDHAEAKIGVAFASPGRVSGFLEGFGSFAGRQSVSGGGGRVGVNFRF